MGVTEIRVEYGLTQNLGDYSNVKLSVSLAANVEEGDDPADVRQHLLEMARSQAQAAVDDALEENGGEVKYYKGPLYQVYTSDARKCAVIAPVGTEMPDGSNWQTRERWRSSYRRRWDTALAKVAKLNEDGYHGYQVIECPDGDLSNLPPMPDPGPEPLWYQRGLKDILIEMQIPTQEWDELAELEHVTADFLQQARTRYPFYSDRADRMTAIRSGVIPPKEPDPEPVVEDDDWDDDEDDDTIF